MRRDLAILDEMIDAAEQAHAIAIDADPATLSRDRMRRDALLWNLTVLGGRGPDLRGTHSGPPRFAPEETNGSVQPDSGWVLEH